MIITMIAIIAIRFTIIIIFSKKKTGNAQKPTIYDCRGANPKHNGEKKKD